MHEILGAIPCLRHNTCCVSFQRFLSKSKNAAPCISNYKAAASTPDLLPQEIMAPFSSRVFTDRNPGLELLSGNQTALRGTDPYAKYRKPYPLH
jgi:hypothetical protein